MRLPNIGPDAAQLDKDELAGQLELVRVERTRLAHKPGDLHIVTDVTLRIMVDLLEP